MVVAAAIAEHNAGRPYSRLSLADAIGRKPDSSLYRTLLSASIQYGLTEGSHNVTSVSLTSLGTQIVMPKSDSERKAALLTAARNISLFADLYKHFDQAKLPTDVNFKNTLIREYNVDPEATDQCIAQFKSDGKYVGLIRAVGGADRVDIPHAEASVGSTDTVDVERESFVDDDEPILPEPVTPAATSGNGASRAPGVSQPETTAPNAIFIGHGHDHDALKSLEELLKQMGVQYVIAKDEAHAGRPISQKIAEEMRKCSAGIFIASADDEWVDANGKTVMRTRQNVVFELGAASFQYGKRIVIFKEAGVEFPTDFSDLGYITYERGRLADKFADLIRELVKLNAIRITAGI